MFKNSSYQQEILPVENSVPIVFCCDDAYAPYLAVAIQSLIACVNPQQGYDILVFHTSISCKNQQKIQLQTQNAPSVSVRFFNIFEKIKQIEKKLFTTTCFTIETWYRIFIPEILLHYSKAIYLDCDITVLTDITKLFEIDLEESLLGAALSLGDISLIHSKTFIRREELDAHEEMEIGEYFSRILGLEDPANDYINSGVLLLDLRKMREQKIAESILEKLNKIKNRYGLTKIC
jgi:lipopolysaccharide biosynthesis glycosyltransferase